MGFGPDISGLQIHWPGLRDYCRKTTKSGQNPKYQLTAPSINWPWTWKHSWMVVRTFRREIYFIQTPLDYKSDDLEYSLLQEGYQKQSGVKTPAHSTINKMGMGMETLRNGWQGLQEGNPFHPDTTGLQILWPGLQITAGTLQKAVRSQKISLKHHQ